LKNTVGVLEKQYNIQDLLCKSKEIAKSYIAMLAFNFEPEVEINFEMDPYKIK
jgi:hypothetical protein